jgi:hypothetical protein
MNKTTVNLAKKEKEALKNKQNTEPEPISEELTKCNDCGKTLEDFGFDSQGRRVCPSCEFCYAPKCTPCKDVQKCNSLYEEWGNKMPSCFGENSTVVIIDKVIGNQKMVKVS